MSNNCAEWFEQKSQYFTLTFYLWCIIVLKRPKLHILKVFFGLGQNFLRWKSSQKNFFLLASFSSTCLMDPYNVADTWQRFHHPYCYFSSHFQQSTARASDVYMSAYIKVNARCRLWMEKWSIFVAALTTFKQCKRWEISGRMKDIWEESYPILKIPPQDNSRFSMN
jgi:hypothetical protein